MEVRDGREETAAREQHWQGAGRVGSWHWQLLRHWVDRELALASHLT